MRLLKEQEDFLNERLGIASDVPMGSPRTSAFEMPVDTQNDADADADDDDEELMERITLSC